MVDMKKLIAIFQHLLRLVHYVLHRQSLIAKRIRGSSPSSDNLQRLLQSIQPAEQVYIVPNQVSYDLLHHSPHKKGSMENQYWIELFSNNSDL
jgi:hypothetical protein